MGMAIRIDGKEPGAIWDVGRLLASRPYESGHINDTYFLETDEGRHILQRVNREVFIVEALVANYEQICPSLQAYESAIGKRLSPRLLPTRETGGFHYLDARGAPWRLIEFVPGALPLSSSRDVRHSFRVAEAMGHFLAFLSTLDPRLIRPTIEDFHDLPGRLNIYRQALENADTARLQAAGSLAEDVAPLLEKARAWSGRLSAAPVRVTHNDAKLDNALLLADRSLVIDLDTVMPGRSGWDYGDLLRSLVCPVGEDEADIGRIAFRMDHFEALTRGYLGPVRDMVEPVEIEALVPGALYILLEQTLRFLTDYLRGDVYYKTAYPAHNLVRAANQFRLLQLTLAREDELEAVIRSI